MHEALHISRLTGHERDVVRILARSGAGSQAAIAREIGVSQVTVSRSFRRLIDLGLVTKEGTTRDAKFRLTPSAAHFSVPPHRRIPVAYDPGRINSYEPNASRWLNDEAAERMRSVSASINHHLDASTYARRIAERFLIDLSWASSNLEGNTYEYLETELLLKYNEIATDRELAETTMILNHKAAITLVLEHLESPEIFSPAMLARVHALLMNHLLGPSELGRVRTTGAEVRIGGSNYRPSSDNGELQQGLGVLTWNASQVTDPFEASFLLLAGCSYVQAFADGNKRLGRIFANVPLLRAGLPPLSFVAIDKSAYINGLLAFHELADTVSLANAISAAYVEAAPLYGAAVASQRTPRSAGVRNRSLIAEVVRIAADALAQNPSGDVAAIIRDHARQAEKNDRQVVEEVAKDSVAALSIENRDVWGVSEDVVRAIKAGRKLGETRPVDAEPSP